MKIIENDISQIELFIEGIRQQEEINSFFSYLIGKSNIYFVGGAIRNIYNKIAIRDIDIIYRPKSKDFSLKSYHNNAITNSLNGYKLCIDGISFDLWSFDKNWAFKRNHYPRTFSNIQYGTFYNFDSLVYGYNEKILQCSNYNNSILTMTLDFVDSRGSYISDNPSVTLNIVKACIYNHKYKLKLSEKVKNYLRNWKTKSGDIELLIKEEYRHYKEVILTKDIYRKIISEL